MPRPGPAGPTPDAPAASAPSPAVSPRVQVHVSSWEIECCTPPPGVGDHVTWILMAVAPDADHDGFDRPGASTRWWCVEHRDDNLVVLVDGPLAAFWPDHAGPPPAAGVRELTVELVAVFHGPHTGTPPTSQGRVTRVQVASQDFAPHPTRPRYRTPVRGTLQLREVTRGPFVFDHGVLGSDTAQHHDIGLLVDLTV